MIDDADAFFERFTLSKALVQLRYDGAKRAARIVVSICQFAHRKREQPMQSVGLEQDHETLESPLNAQFSVGLRLSADDYGVGRRRDMSVCGKNLEAVAEYEFEQGCGTRVHRMHNDIVADPGVALTVEPDELFKPGCGPHEPDAMHGSGDYHIKCYGRSLKFP